MNDKIAESYLPCFRSGRPMDKRVLKAVQIAGKSPLLREKLNSQKQFDDKLVAAIHLIQPPEDLKQKLAVTKCARPLCSQLLNPAMLSVVFGVLLMIGFLVWEDLSRRESFPGREAVERIVNVAQEMSGAELDPSTALAGELGDTFYMRGFEGFSLGADLAQIRAVGTRVFKQNGHPVAQLAIDPHDALLYVFRAADFGVKVESEWRVFSKDPWVVAVRGNQGLCTAITFHGKPEEMRLFLKELHP